MTHAHIKTLRAVADALDVVRKDITAEVNEGRTSDSRVAAASAAIMLTGLRGALRIAADRLEAEEHARRSPLDDKPIHYDPKGRPPRSSDR